jgi:hypothetical protein
MWGSDPHDDDEVESGFADSKDEDAACDAIDDRSTKISGYHKVAET